mmetsp:Transcript_21319/g.47652  ORF Transcript_21319/g.47652 Transcript_21319/m.47652 type:complete len:312 (-) Transcript_21319:463-1398(-)
MPRVESMPTAAMATPYTPVRCRETRIVTETARTGQTHESLPTERPWMMTVAGPVLPALAMDLVGAKSYEVQYSVHWPMVTPQTMPMTMAPKMFHWRRPRPWSCEMMAAAKPIWRSEAPLMPPWIARRRMRWRTSGSALAVSLPVRTRKMPIKEATMPEAASRNGSTVASTVEVSINSKLASTVGSDSVTLAMIEPVKDSKRSAPIPATSPTLSPTLSAITPGLRGSSSGIPASTLPTRSEPTSAALVKMPPPTRAKSAIDDAPKPKPARYSDSRKIRNRPASPASPKPTTLKPMVAPERNDTRSAGPRPWS